jgi:PAS domain S-box-containing protein
MKRAPRTSVPARPAKPAPQSEPAATPEFGPMMLELQRRAVAQLRRRRKDVRAQDGAPDADAPKDELDPRRLVHELEVHQVELELQNAELKAARDQTETLLASYTDLYDFAPVGYLTLAADATIRQVNLTATRLVGIERGRLVGKSFGALIGPERRPAFHDFLAQVFAGEARHSDDFALLVQGQPARAVNIEAQRSPDRKECRIAVKDITDRKRAEDEARLRSAAMEATADAVFITGRDGIIQYVNPAFTAMSGYAAADALGKKPSLVKSGAHEPPFYRDLWRTILAGRTWRGQMTNRHQDGHLYVSQQTITPVRDAEGGVTHFISVEQDITERAATEARVRVSEIRYRRLFEAAHDGVLLLDPGTRRITDANPFMTQLLGYARDELVGKELFEIGLLKDKAASKEMFRRLKQKHEVRYEDLPLKSRKGRLQEVEVVANLYQEAGHSVIQCNIRDITARKLAEQELSEKARLLDLSHDAIIVRDVRGRIRYWNHGAEELYGWSRKEALGKVSNRLFRTEYPQPLKRLTEELDRTDRWSGELVHHTRAGRRINVLVRKALDRDRAGAPASVLENITDVTERRQAEEAQRRVEVLAASNEKLRAEIKRRQAVEGSLRKSEKHQSRLLEQSHRLQGQLRQLSRQILTAQEEERREISRELHDVVAQTLAGINIRLAVLKKEAALDSRNLGRDIARTQRLVEKSVEIVHQFARELRPAVLDDLGLVPALQAFLKDFTMRTGIRANLKATAKVEQLDLARRTVLFRVAQEALTNVSRHARAGRVEVSLQDAPGSLSMRIKDDGKSFDVRRALDGKGRKRLGLLGMRERLEMIGGGFGIESVPGKGTTIIASIPLGKVARGKVESAEAKA